MKNFFVLLLSFCLLPLATSFLFTVQPSKEECFYEDLKKGTSTSIMFQVTAGGYLDIDLHVKNPEGRNILMKKKQSEGRYSFVAESDGVHAICFNNRMSTVTKKEIAVDIVVGQSDVEAKLMDQQDVVSPLGNHIMELSNSLLAIQAEQRYMKLREQRHRYTNESTSRSVMWWSIIETIILICVSLFQVFYLKKFFEDRRSL